MRFRLPDLHLTGAQVLRPDGFSGAPLWISSGRLSDSPGLAGAVELSGYLLLPGIVDLHGPQPFNHPIRGEKQEAPQARIGALDRAAAAQGITTCHLAQGWSWEGGLLDPESAERAMLAVATRRVAPLVDLRVKPCVDIRHVGGAGRLLSAIARFGLRYASVEDNLEPLAALYRLNPAAFDRRARGLGLTSEDLLARLAIARSASSTVPANLRAIANGFDAEGVRFGSLGDPDAETRELHAMIGARLAEFPRSRRAAMAARSVGDAVLLSAPATLRETDGLAVALARDFLTDGGRIAFASVGDLSSLTAFAFHVADRGWCDLAAAWASISTTPAQAVGLADRGAIAPGLRADLVLLHQRTRRIDAVICDGRLVHVRPALRSRFQDIWSARLAAQ